MTKLSIAGVVALVIGSLTLQAQVAAQTTREMEKQFKAAQYKQEVLGDLTGAIEDYKKIARGPDRDVAARALLGMAQSYETLGRPEARDTYALVIGSYGDQPVATEARTRLAALAPPKRDTGAVTPRQIDANELFGARNMSVEGDLVVGNNGRDLLMRDLGTNQTTRVIAGPPQATFVGPQAFSPDNRQIAYGYADRATGTQPLSASLRVVGAQAGSQPRTLVSPAPGVDVLTAVAWSVDGKSVLSTIGRSLAWVSVADGAVRTIKTWEQGQGPSGLRLSPDGGSIAYSAPARPGSTERHIYVVDANGQNETDVVHIAGANTVPIWTPDGGHLLFMSDRSGTRALWSVTMHTGRSSGEPSLVQANFTGFPLGMTRSGHLYYTQFTGVGTMEFIAERHQADAQGVQAVIGASGTFSPDGRSIAFNRLQAQSKAIVVRSLETGEERSYPNNTLSVVSPRWLADGSGVLAFTWVGDSPSFNALDIKSGSFKRLFPRDTDEHVRSSVVDLSPDRRTAYMLTRKGPANVANPWTGVVAVDLGTGAERSIATIPSPGLATSHANNNMGIAVSPDGTTLAIEAWADAATSQARIVTIRVDGTGYREIVGSFRTYGTPDQMRWTPDGRTIMYLAVDENGGSRLMRVSAGGGQPEPDSLDFGKLSRFRLVNPMNLDISRDGLRIAFAGETRSSYELWALENVMPVLNARR